MTDLFHWMAGNQHAWRGIGIMLLAMLCIGAIALYIHLTGVDD